MRSGVQGLRSPRSESNFWSLRCVICRLGTEVRGLESGVWILVSMIWTLASEVWSLESVNWSLQP